MNLNTLAMYQKNFLNMTFALFFTANAALAQVTAPAPAGPPRRDSHLVARPVG